MVIISLQLERIPILDVNCSIKKADCERMFSQSAYFYFSIRSLIIFCLFSTRVRPWGSSAEPEVQNQRLYS